MSQRLARLALCFYTVLAALILWLEAVVLLCCARPRACLCIFGRADVVTSCFPEFRDEFVSNFDLGEGGLIDFGGFS